MGGWGYQWNHAQWIIPAKIIFWLIDWKNAKCGVFVFLYRQWNSVWNCQTHFPLFPLLPFFLSSRCVWINDGVDSGTLHCWRPPSSAFHWSLQQMACSSHWAASHWGCPFFFCSVFVFNFPFCAGSCTPVGWHIFRHCRSAPPLFGLPKWEGWKLQINASNSSFGLKPPPHSLTNNWTFNVILFIISAFFSWFQFYFQLSHNRGVGLHYPGLRDLWCGQHCRFLWWPPCQTALCSSISTLGCKWHIPQKNAFPPFQNGCLHTVQV